MPVEVIMPKVDMDMASGKVMTWHVGEGERVEKGAALFDIETDKAAMEVEAEAAGYLHHRVPEGTELAIGAPVAFLYAEGEDVGDMPALEVSESEVTEHAEPAPRPERAEAAPIVAPAAGRIRATPLARSLARDGGIDLAAIPGSGARGRVQAADVEVLLKTVPSTAPAVPATFSPETGPLSVTRSRGGTGIPVVMIHGFASDSLSWAPLETHLKRRPVIRIDLPGHGKSPKRATAGFAALAGEIRHCFDALDLEEAHLVGHSVGGALALALADTRPRNVASLTLIAPAGLGPEINGAALAGICAATRAESLGPWLKEMVADETLVTDSYVRLAMAGRAEPQLRAAQLALADVLFPDGVQAFDLRAALSRIEVPTRIIWGKRDAIIPWKHALGGPGRVALHLFDAVGHIPQIEDPDAVGSLLAAQL